MLRRRWRILLLVLFVCCAALVLILALQPKPPEIVFLAQPPNPDPLWRDRLMQYVPQNQSWAWLWKLQEAVFPKRKRLDLITDEYELTGPQSTNAAILGLGPPRATSADGLRVWFLSRDGLKPIQEHLRAGPAAAANFTRSMMSTADGIGSMVYMGAASRVTVGGPNIGLTANFSPRVRRDGLDLGAFITRVNVVTNLANDLANVSASPLPNTNSVTGLKFGARLQIPRGDSVLVLGTPVPELGGNTICVIIETK